MGQTPLSQVMDPAALPVGTELGEWRVVSWGGRGTYGTVYRVERRGHEGQGHYALKMALHARDERFEREWELLSRMNHPNVPRLEDHGLWQHPSGPFPYMVMQWITGVPLYQWAAQRNPTSRQVLRLLEQVARALEATSKAGGVHRDVKGDNVLVRLADERAFLTDFGAGLYRGAATVTLQTLPPGTPQYRSPEAWAFQELFTLHPVEHYKGNTCDDLFALGVTAYRLVTDEYPPPTDPRQAGSEVWEPKGSKPQSPRALNPRVYADLDTLILRLLGAPQRRFKGQAQLAADALEHAAENAGHEADVPLFEWETEQPAVWTREEKRRVELHGHRLRRRAKETAQRSEQMDAEEKAEAARQKALEPTPSRTHLRLVHSRGRVLRVLPWVVPSIGTLVLVFGTHVQHGPEQPFEEPTQKHAEAADAGTADGGTSGAAEEALTSVSAYTEPEPDWNTETIGTMKIPLPGQRRPPCPQGEHAIRGGCWRPIHEMESPCQTGYYEWDKRCYLPVFAPTRQPTSEPR
ncbi:MAG TPA: serine/threonine-protein kinase [Myxococcaceae bacterium]|nr:serine/threonine-protein kinase [Myxococcaceae bacterium]